MRSALVLVSVGLVLLAIGLYWVGWGIANPQSAQNNTPPCGTPQCSPPSPIWPFVVFAALFVLVGCVALILGIVLIRRERKERRAPSSL